MDDAAQLHDEYISIEAAAAIWHVKTRQAHRYADTGHIRTKRVGPHNRKLLHRGDVEALAAERQAGVPIPQPKADMVPAGQMLDYIRERDAQLATMQQQLTDAAARIGYLQAQLDGQRPLLEDRDALHARIRELEAELDAARRPWLARLLRGLFR